MGLLSKDQIFAAQDITTKIVEVPEWGGSVIVRGLSGKQRDDWEASMSERRGTRVVMNMDNFRARLVALTVVDEAGLPMFHAGDIDDLGGKSGAALDRLYTVAAELSGISQKDVEDLTRDFEPAAGGDSSST